MIAPTVCLKIMVGLSLSRKGRVKKGAKMARIAPLVLETGWLGSRDYRNVWFLRQSICFWRFVGGLFFFFLAGARWSVEPKWAKLNMKVSKSLFWNLSMEEGRGTEVVQKRWWGKGGREEAIWGQFGSIRVNSGQFGHFCQMIFVEILLWDYSEAMSFFSVLIYL